VSWSSWGARRHAARPSRRSGRGQSLVEFALILPLLLLLTLGVVDAARVFTSWISLTNGVREAALYASEESDPPRYADTTTINNRVAEEASDLDPANITIDAPTCDNGTCDASSDTVTIRASYQMSLIFPLVQDVLGDPLTLSVEATAPIVDHTE
jgi:Flp pilus assembly protein TadG